MKTKTRMMIQGTVRLPDGTQEILTSWFDYTTMLGQRRALKQHRKWIQLDADRRFPGWEQIDWHYTNLNLPALIRYMR